MEQKFIPTRQNFFIYTHTCLHLRVDAWIKTAYNSTFLFHLWIVIRVTRDTNTNLIGATKKKASHGIAGKTWNDTLGKPETYVWSTRKRYLREWCYVLKTMASRNECFPPDQQIMGKARSAETLLASNWTTFWNICWNIRGNVSRSERAYFCEFLLRISFINILTSQLYIDIFFLFHLDFRLSH